MDAESVPVTKNSRGVPQYPLMLLLQLDLLRVYELIINSPSCRLQYGRLLSVCRGPRFRSWGSRPRMPPRRAATLETGQLVMSDNLKHLGHWHHVE